MRLVARRALLINSEFNLVKRNFLGYKSSIAKLMKEMPMTQLIKETIPSLLVRNLPRDLILSIEEALIVGDQRGHTAAKGMNSGHRANALGQMRHFHMNEAFHGALKSAGANPPPIKGNGVITGTVGIFTIGRFNISHGIWNSGRRSQLRKQLSEANRSIEPLVQHSLFEQYIPATQATAFFVACFSGKRDQSDAAICVQIAVPDREMKGWLFRESLGMFLQRYEKQPAVQQDRAKPKLKVGVGHILSGTGSD
jgi:hypothetical protein